MAANEWIGARLKSLRKTKTELAKAMAIDPARISEIIGGRRNVQISEIPPMATMLEMSPEELVQRLVSKRGGGSVASPAPPSTAPALAKDGFVARPVELTSGGRTMRDLPIYGSAMGGADGSFEMNGQVVDYVERPPALAGARTAYGIYVQGDSMSPRFEAGWLVHVNPARPPKRGDNVVVQIRSADPHAPPLAYVKVFESRTAKRLMVSQFNPKKDLSWPIEDVVSVHRIVGIGEM